MKKLLLKRLGAITFALILSLTTLTSNAAIVYADETETENVDSNTDNDNAENKESVNEETENSEDAENTGDTKDTEVVEGTKTNENEVAVTPEENADDTDNNQDIVEDNSVASTDTNAEINADSETVETIASEASHIENTESTDNTDDDIDSGFLLTTIEKENEDGSKLTVVVDGSNVVKEETFSPAENQIIQNDTSETIEKWETITDEEGNEVDVYIVETTAKVSTYEHEDHEVVYNEVKYNGGSDFGYTEAWNAMCYKWADLAAEGYYPYWYYVHPSGEGFVSQFDYVYEIHYREYFESVDNVVLSSITYKADRAEKEEPVVEPDPPKHEDPKEDDDHDNNDNHDNDNHDNKHEDKKEPIESNKELETETIQSTTTIAEDTVAKADTIETDNTIIEDEDTALAATPGEIILDRSNVQTGDDGGIRNFIGIIIAMIIVAGFFIIDKLDGRDKD